MNVPSTGADLAESNGLLWWQINNDESVGAGLLCVCDRTLFSVGENRVVVTHEDDRCLQALLACFAHVLETVGVVDTVGEGDLICECPNKAISDLRCWHLEWSGHQR